MNQIMLKKIFYLGLMTLIVVGSSAFVASGAPVLGTDNFDAGESSRAGWQSTGSDGVDTIPLTGGVGNSGYYQLYFDGTGTPGQQIGYIFNTDANHIGNYSNLSVSFNFLVKPVSDPTVAMSFYFRSGTEKWSRDFTIPSNAWTSVSFDFTGAGWSSLNGGVDFMAAAANVTEIGFYVNHLNANGSTFTYGLDNWTTSMPVPEPESMALAIVACFSLVLTFRQPILAVVRRRRETDREI